MALKQLRRRDLSLDRSDISVAVHQMLDTAARRDQKKTLTLPSAGKALHAVPQLGGGQ